MNLKRWLFNFWFGVAPEAATRWLNFKLSVAEALDNMVRDEEEEAPAFAWIFKNPEWTGTMGLLSEENNEG